MTLLSRRTAARPGPQQRRTAAVPSRSGRGFTLELGCFSMPQLLRKCCGWGQPRSVRTVRLIFFLISLLPLALCSCAHTAPTAEQTSGDEFVYIASVHSQPVENEPKPNAWQHVYQLLDQRRILILMTSSGGVASISVERDRSREAVELLRGDAARKGYWIKISKEF